jgi:hypothetical protein
MHFLALHKINEKITAIIVSGMLLLASGARANELERILDQANKYTVKIYNSTDTPFIEDTYSPSSGSGFLIDKANGIIITNAHVASYSPALNRVNFKYSNPVQSKQAYIDADIDLALLKIDPSTIPKDPPSYYKNKFKGWGDFLGTGNVAPKLKKYRTFINAKLYVHKLKLNNSDEWYKYTKSKSLPKNIPSTPWVVYKNEWKGLSDFLGTSRKPRSKKS